MPITPRIAALLTILLVSPCHGASPSFDCAKANNDMEDLICADDGLATLDQLMAEAYTVARKNYPTSETKTLKAEQRDWIEDRNDCWNTDDKHACATYAYRSRITELELTSGTLVVPEPVYYRCDGGPYDYLTAIFYRNTAMPAVVLTLSWVEGHDGQIIAFLQPDGSGARYSDGNSAFWEHHSEATLEANGTQSTCTKQ